MNRLQSTRMCSSHTPLSAGGGAVLSGSERETLVLSRAGCGKLMSAAAGGWAKAKP